jgi:hypothetical protein
MWFLIKSTVFLCLMLVVLSFFGNDEQSETRLSAQGVTNAVISAGEIVHYMSGICVEKPEVCIKGAETLSLLGERTREGAKVAYQLLEGQLGDGQAQDVMPAAVTAAQPTPPIAASPELAASSREMVNNNIRTGTIAKPSADAMPSRIPVPQMRPANL